MQLSEDIERDICLVKSYTFGSIQIGQESFSGNMILTPSSIKAWDVQSVSDIDKSALFFLTNLTPEVIIIGTGAVQSFLDLSAVAFVTEQNIGIEVMDTYAACRTYNLLASEKRNVVAGLIIT